MKTKVQAAAEGGGGGVGMWTHRPGPLILRAAL